MRALGLDLSIARAKPLAIAVLEPGHARLLTGAPAGPGIVRDPAEVSIRYQAWADEVGQWLAPWLDAPVAIGIDAPAAFPPPGQRRPAETAVRAVTGLYFTPDYATALAHPTQFYHWMLAGVALWTALRQRAPHATLRETYPHLGWHRRGIRSRKQSPQGFADRAAWLHAHLPPIAPAPTSHDHLDALLAAWLATSPDAVCYGSGTWDDGIWG